ncbi:uncharacterized protein LOC111702940 [Eurytemora carolleeae]|uniref:uncharacterized protein LOC111702940 n=1 Tax=Eurytemora carolleeae TaxID=1294199 RepID=UPI000C7919EA|nr:uncharacterized protein LOC111702940 [Eurytemora carolleeae]XP_023330526.1 uncharacterized protein LOC111702940 [Eurytemora carolleeae]|eukprot:XP_023330525.1 uncharacterized protein LOC111702940 [Eurytemora affinis]
MKTMTRIPFENIVSTIKKIATTTSSIINTTLTTFSTTTSSTFPTTTTLRTTTRAITTTTTTTTTTTMATTTVAPLPESHFFLFIGVFILICILLVGLGAVGLAMKTRWDRYQLHMMPLYQFDPDQDDLEAELLESPDRGRSGPNRTRRDFGTCQKAAVPPQLDLL